MPITMEQVVVIGGGAAGCAAALAAAEQGLRVTLIDEHPQSTAAMSLDAPYFYGARLAAVLDDDSTIADRVLGANEPLLACLEAGVEVLTHTCVWGIFVPGENNAHLACRQLGLADREKSWLLGFDYLIIAAGARDLVLSFPGWHLPGVLGAQAANALLGRYQALGGSRMLILGSGNTALQLADQALEHGIALAGLVEPGRAVQGDPQLAETLKAKGVPFFLEHSIAEALGAQEVNAARLCRLHDSHDDHDGHADDADAGFAIGASREIACDTICMAYGRIANVELPAAAGCALTFDAARGSWAPQLDAAMQTSLPGIFVIGDAAGVHPAALPDPQTAIAQAQRAVAAIVANAGQTSAPTLQPVCPARTAETDCPTLRIATEVIPDGMCQAGLQAVRGDGHPYWQQWLNALVAAGGMDYTVCQCEDVRREDLLAVRAPRYVGSGNSAPAQALARLLVDGQLSQDMQKRITRVGMGHCQGRRCREHSAMLLAQAARIPLAAVQPASYRNPVRALPLDLIRDPQEPEALRARWPTWLHPVDGSPSSAH